MFSLLFCCFVNFWFIFQSTKLPYIQCIYLCVCVCVKIFPFPCKAWQRSSSLVVTHGKCMTTRRHLTSKAWGKNAWTPRTYFLVETVHKTATSNMWHSSLRYFRSVHHTDELNSDRGDPRVTTSLKLHGAAVVTEGSWLGSADQGTNTLPKK